MDNRKTVTGKYQPRTATYCMTAEAARTMYKTRSSADKGTPFKQYILQCIRDSGILYDVTDIELV